MSQGSASPTDQYITLYRHMHVNSEEENAIYFATGFVVSKSTSKASFSKQQPELDFCIELCNKYLFKFLHSFILINS